MHGAQVAAATNVLFDQSKIVSRDLHRQTFPRLLSRDRLSAPQELLDPTKFVPETRESANQRVCDKPRRI
jgi:hypothetical protein